MKKQEMRQMNVWKMIFVNNDLNVIYSLSIAPLVYSFRSELLGLAS